MRWGRQHHFGEPVNHPEFQRVRKPLGTIVYEDGGLICSIQGMTLREGAFNIIAVIDQPASKVYNFGGWARVHGDDGTVVMERVLLGDVEVDNRRGRLGSMTVYQPLRVHSVTAARNKP